MDVAYRAMLTATVVALVLMAARLCGRQLAGLLAGAPLITAPALTWIALDRGAAASHQAAIGSVVGCVVVAAFALAYDRAARRTGPLGALAIASAVLALVSWPAYALLQGSLPAALAASLLACALALAALPSEEAPVAAAASPSPANEGRIAGTALLAGAVSAVIALCGPELSPTVAGLIASLPIVGAAAAVAQHMGGTSTSRFWRGYVAGLAVKAAFGAGFAALVVVAHPGYALAGATVLGAMLATLGRHWFRAGASRPEARLVSVPCEAGRMS